MSLTIDGDSYNLLNEQGVLVGSFSSYEEALDALIRYYAQEHALLQARSCSP